jgi:hypothetical protein
MHNYSHINQAIIRGSRAVSYFEVKFFHCAHAPVWVSPLEISCSLRVLWLFITIAFTIKRVFRALLSGTRPPFPCEICEAIYIHDLVWVLSLNFLPQIPLETKFKKKSLLDC